VQSAPCKDVLSFHSCTVRLDTVETFIYLTGAQLDCSKNIKIYIKIYMRGAHVNFNVKIYKGGYTLVTLPRIVTPYRDSVDRTRDRVTYQKKKSRCTFRPAQTVTVSSL